MSQRKGFYCCHPWVTFYYNHSSSALNIQGHTLDVVYSNSEVWHTIASSHTLLCFPCLNISIFITPVSKSLSLAPGPSCLKLIFYWGSTSSLKNFSIHTAGSHKTKLTGLLPNNMMYYPNQHENDAIDKMQLQ